MEQRVRYLDILETGNGPELKGSYGLLGFNGKVAVIGYSSINEPPRAYSVVFSGAENAENLAAINVQVE